MSRPRKRRQVDIATVDIGLTDGTHILLDPIFNKAFVYELDVSGRRFDVGSTSILSMYRIMRKIAAEKRAEHLATDGEENNE